jgi:hypothetical protein
VAGEISTTITEKTVCRTNARFHKMKKQVFPAVRLVGGCSRSRKLLNMKECFANVDAEKIRAGDSWVGVG